MDLTGSQPTSLSSHPKRPQRPCPPPQLIAHFLRLAEGLSPSLTLHRLAIPISQNPTTCSASRHSDLPDPRSSIFPSLFPSSIVQVKKKKSAVKHQARSGQRPRAPTRQPAHSDDSRCYSVLCPYSSSTAIYLAHHEAEVRSPMVPESREHRRVAQRRSSSSPFIVRRADQQEPPHTDTDS